MARRALVALVLALCAGVLAAATPSAGASPPPAYVAPVDAAVLDGFRPPAHPYGPGNRGLEYDTAPGTEVRAVAAGVVTFAGLVAGTRHVTVRHRDGVRTSYSFLDRVDVTVGQQLAQGAVLGTSGGRLHLGARLGDAYFDPASLFGGGSVRLVPFDEPPGDGPSGERSALSQLIGAVGGLAARGASWAVTGTGATVEWLRREGVPLARSAAHYLERSLPGVAQLHLVLASLEAWRRARAVASRPCTSLAGVMPPPPIERRAAVLVGGLGSTSAAAAIDDLDTGALGYQATDVVRFSYAGGRVPDPEDGLVAIPARTYVAADTQRDLYRAGARLADLIEAVAASLPDVPIDVFAHSQGGVVTRLALIELEARHGIGWLKRLGLVATLGTPHGGADLATAVHAAGSTQAGSTALDAVATVGSLELDDDAIAIAQLAETSGLVRELSHQPIPQGVHALSIAARGDLVVPVPRTVVAGAEEVVVPLAGFHAHDQLPGSAEAARELALALAGLPPGCQSFRAALLDQVAGEAISWAEDTAGSVAWLAGLGQGAPLGG